MAIDKTADEAADKTKPDPALVAQQSLQTGLGQPLPAGVSGPGGTAPVVGVPIATQLPAGASGPGGTAPVAGVPIDTRPNDPNAVTIVNGQVVPYPFGKVETPLVLNASIQPPEPVTPIPVKTEGMPAVAQNAGPAPAPAEPKDLALKDMISSVINSKAAPAGTNGNGFNFGDFLKAAGPKLGDFLQRWGMGLQGAPEGKTQGDIQREQAFELQKTQTQAEVAAKQMALDNQYQQQRMQLQNQMNLANLPIEAKQQLANRIAELDAEYQNQVKLIPLQVQQMMAQRQWLPGANPADHLFSQGQ